jgi:outer membrane protein assembly factor BamB
MATPDRPNLLKRILLPKTWKGRSALGACAVAVVVVIGAGIAYLVSRPHAIHNSHVAFTAPTKTTPPPPVKKKVVNNFLWPFYGYTAQRIHSFTGAKNLYPPFRRGWTLGGNAVMEFAPSIAGNHLFYLDDGATIKSVNATKGKLVWMTHLGKLSAETPAIDIKLHRLYAGILSLHGTTIGSVGGEFYSVSMHTGKVLWHFPVPSGTESSPIVIGNSVFFGDQGGTLYSVNARTGHIQWKFQTGAAIKAGPAYSDGKLFFGNYAGGFYAVDAKTGHQVWSASASGFLSSGNFYATPVVAYGRVYAGNTNGYMYSFSAATGQVAWSVSTGAYVYSAAAVQDTPHLGPTVYVGSYTGTIYALNARNGATRWSHNTGDSISGPISIINNVAYFSGVYSHDTTGLNATTGRQVFHFHDGAYGSMVASPHALYLDGHYLLYQFLPRDHKRAAHHLTSGSKHSKKH